MSRSRRQVTGRDSLEMLLDTICNTFGGILFIALLVTILMQLTGQQELPLDPASISPEEIESLVREQAQLLSEIDRIRANQEADDLLTTRLAPANIQDLLARRRQLTDQLHLVENRVQALLAESAHAAIDIENTLQQLSDLRTAIPEQQRKLATLEDTIEREVEKRSMQVRLSEVRSTLGKREVALILRYGRVYLWHRYDARGNQIGLNEDDFIVLDSDSSSVTVRPNPLRGISLDGSAQARQGVSTLLATFSPNRHTIVVVARPDSYHAFSQIRDVVVASGFDYRLFVMSENSGVVDRGGSGGSVQ